MAAITARYKVACKIIEALGLGAHEVARLVLDINCDTGDIITAYVTSYPSRDSLLKVAEALAEGADSVKVIPVASIDISQPVVDTPILVVTK